MEGECLFYAVLYVVSILLEPKTVAEIVIHVLVPIHS